MRPLGVAAIVLFGCRHPVTTQDSSPKDTARDTADTGAPTPKATKIAQLFVPWSLSAPVGAAGGLHVGAVADGSLYLWTAPVSGIPDPTVLPFGTATELQIADVVLARDGGDVVVAGLDGVEVARLSGVSTAPGTAMAVGDFDGDGVPDLAALDAAGGVVVATGPLTGTLVGTPLVGETGATALCPVPGTGGDALAIVVPNGVDVARFGRGDARLSFGTSVARVFGAGVNLLVGDAASGDVWVVPATVTGTVDATAATTTVTHASFTSLADARDIDGDGLPDLASWTTSELSLVGLATGAVDATMATPISASSADYGIDTVWAPGDLDGDGHPDLVVGERGEYSYDAGQLLFDVVAVK